MELSKLFINGKWVPPLSNEYFDAINPATNEVIGKIPSGNRGDAVRAVDRAFEAKKIIQSMSVFERSNLLRNIAEEIESKKETLAHILTLDQGKPFYSESIKEVESVIRGFQEASEQIKWLETSVIPFFQCSDTF
ncbi:aldehyde dehydrogenase family protein [Alkalihalobacillus sp. TS-13]|uniref:aldehyde dehydrogenase family protein n=1 Tax=Alkalihalobacillus sp. TS-13 TaxID=2842455 RepID=UPI001C88DAB0|nr:aldehyde dehydrogenase family protein [Alkalihalobacillus sp. TS-13]